MKQNYQTIDAAVTAMGVPKSVSVPRGEIVADVSEGLLAMAVDTVLQVMAGLMDADVAAVCGPKGKHDADRTAVRHGSEKGSVTLGGRWVPVDRPRMRATDGSGELPVPVGHKVEQAATAMSKSAAPLGELDLVALMLDGVHFGEHVCVVALGVGIDGTKYPLALAAEARLEALSKELDTPHPGAAASLREGLAETLTVLRLGVSPTGKQFHGVNGHLHLAALRHALDEHTAAEDVSTVRHDEPVIAP